MSQKNSDVERAASYIVEKCRKSGIVVHRYNAKSSNSIYLKFDWGVAQSLRISDHKGIEKYHYRFNLIQGLKDKITVSYRNNTYSNYYPFRSVYDCLEDILENREKIIEKNGIEKYGLKMSKIESQINRLPREKLYPFWKYGKRVD